MKYSQGNEALKRMGLNIKISMVIIETFIMHDFKSENLFEKEI